MSQAIHTSYPKGLLFRGLTTNSTEGDFIVPVPQADEPVSVDSSTPTANSVVVGCGGSQTFLYPFGTDADNETFSINVYLWKKCAASSTTTSNLWVPFYVGGFDVTLSSTLNGVAGGLISDSEYLADTITEMATNTWDDRLVTVRSYANNQLAEIAINTEGYEKLEVRFDMVLAASGNVLYRQM